MIGSLGKTLCNINNVDKKRVLVIRYLLAGFLVSNNLSTVRPWAWILAVLSHYHKLGIYVI
jgi:hypothetical protein